MNRISILIICILSLTQVKAQQTIRFTNPDSLLAYAVRNSVAVKIGDAHVLQAKYQTIYAKINRLNPRASANYAVTDNTRLPVNFFPAVIFGGSEGSFKEVQNGKQYVQSVYLTPQIDIVNPFALAKLRSANLNEELSFVNNVLIKKTLSESIVAAYFNIVSLGHQVSITSQTLLHADSILNIFQNKHDQGIIRSQDVNNAKVNQLMIKDRLHQIQNAMEQQYTILKLLCDADHTTTIVIEHQEDANTFLSDPEVVLNPLLTNQAQLQRQYSASEYKASKASYYPSLSLIGNWAWQENSDQHFFDDNARWIPSSYIGLRLSFTIPDAGRILQTATAKTDWKIAGMNLKHNAVQQEAEYVQLLLEYKTAKETLLITKEIMLLKEDTYRKDLNLFVQDIYPADNLLLVFNDALTARLNFESAGINLQYQISKIIINNNIR